jgi:hypothetical protein
MGGRHGIKWSPPPGGTKVKVNVESNLASLFDVVRRLLTSFCSANL